MTTGYKLNCLLLAEIIRLNNAIKNLNQSQAWPHILISMLEPHQFEECLENRKRIYNALLEQKTECAV